MSSVLTVSQLNRYVGFKLKQDIKLRSVAISGEISNLSAHYKTGHLFFTLKDETSALKAVMFSSAAANLRFMPKDGMKVIALGNIECYERDGVYQIVCASMSPIGEGSRSAELEALKQKLTLLGVFDENNKKRIPEAPKKIGVVTSPDAAALQDVLSIIERRYPIAKVMISPTNVQGDDAPQSIKKAIINADSKDCDVIIITRGGGSSENLMAFNDERVVMAVYNCKTPVISAVGHETDTTLCDYAADMRAPTPSAAAEIAVPKTDNLKGILNGYNLRMQSAMDRKMSAYSIALTRLKNTLDSHSPEKRLDALSHKLEMLSVGINRSISTKLIGFEASLSERYSKLEALNPLGVLNRGFAVVKNEGGSIITKDNVAVGDDIKIMTKDMELTAKVGSVTVM